MEHTEHRHFKQLNSQTAASTPVAPATQPNRTATPDAEAAGPVRTPPAMALTPEKTMPKQPKCKPKQQKFQTQPSKSLQTSKAPQQRRATIGSIHEAGPAKKGPATPCTRSAKTPSSPHKSKSGPKPSQTRTTAESRPFDQIQAEHLYLFSNLRQQEARIRTLVAALATVQSQLQLPVTTAEARRLRKNAGFIKSKLRDAEQQERLALLGIGHVSAELQSRFRHLHLHQHLYQQQQHIAQFYDHVHGDVDDHADDHVPVQPETPCLVPRQERRSGVEAEFMSPMSPLAPVFQPGASVFYGHIDSIVHTVTNSISGVMVESGEGDAHDVAGEDASKQESLGGSTFDGEAEAEDKGDSNFTPRTVPNEDALASSPAKHGLKSDADAAGMHYVFDAQTHGNGTGAGDGYGESDDSDEFMPREIRMRRGSHGGKQLQQQSLTPARHKRMSLPPVRFSWPEKDE